MNTALFGAAAGNRGKDVPLNPAGPLRLRPWTSSQTSLGDAKRTLHSPTSPAQTPPLWPIFSGLLGKPAPVNAGEKRFFNFAEGREVFLTNGSDAQRLGP